MTGLEVRVQTWFGAAVELAYSFFAVVLLAFPLLALGDNAFGEPLGVAVAPLAIFAGIVGMAAYRLQDRSFERLGHLVVAAFGAAIVWVILVGLLIVLLELPFAARDPRPLFVTWTMSTATGLALVYYGDDALA